MTDISTLLKANDTRKPWEVEDDANAIRLEQLYEKINENLVGVTRITFETFQNIMDVFDLSGDRPDKEINTIFNKATSELGYKIYGGKVYPKDATIFDMMPTATSMRAGCNRLEAYENAYCERTGAPKFVSPEVASNVR